MKSLKEVLMERDGISEEEAEEAIERAREELRELLAEGDMDSAYYICETHFGLEPDYLEELI